jgi:peptide/nickel transport system ATP-binding protein
MRHGEVVEQGPAAQVLVSPQADYTKALVAAVPGLKPRLKELDANSNVLLRVTNLQKTYRTSSGLFGGTVREVHAAKKINLELKRESSLALVGESGSGKSTLARCIIGLESVDSGLIEIDGERISGRTRAELRPFRKHVQMVFQDPYASLNPRQRVGDIIALGPMLNGVSREQAIAEARELLHLVGLKPDAVDRYPHEFSGGQRQRIGIARALAVKPKLIVADEPVSALDVSVQKQVLELLNDLRKSFGLSMLFITHDLRVAATVCEEIAIMQRGEIVERGATAEIFAAPSHSYTRSLFDAVPGREWISSLG